MTDIVLKKSYVLTSMVRKVPTLVGELLTDLGNLDSHVDKGQQEFYEAANDDDERVGFRERVEELRSRADNEYLNTVLGCLDLADFWSVYHTFDDSVLNQDVRLTPLFLWSMKFAALFACLASKYIVTVLNTIDVNDSDHEEFFAELFEKMADYLPDREILFRTVQLNEHTKKWLYCCLSREIASKFFFERAGERCYPVLMAKLIEYGYNVQFIDYELNDFYNDARDVIIETVEPIFIINKIFVVSPYDMAYSAVNGSIVFRSQERENMMLALTLALKRFKMPTLVVELSGAPPSSNQILSIMPMLRIINGLKMERSRFYPNVCEIVNTKNTDERCRVEICFSRVKSRTTNSLQSFEATSSSSAVDKYVGARQEISPSAAASKYYYLSSHWIETPYHALRDKFEAAFELCACSGNCK